MSSGALPERPRGDAAQEPSFVRKVLIVALVIVLLLALWQVSLVLILTFGGVVLSVALRNLSAPLQRFFRLPAPLALLIATLVFCAAMIGLIDLFGTLASQQFTALFHRIPEAWAGVQDWLKGIPFGRTLLAALPNPSAGLQRVFEVLPLAGGILGALGECLLVLAVGIYFAADAPTYVEGVLRLLPVSRRARAREIMLAMGEALRKWLIGMSFDMLFLGVMVFFGLWAVGTPYAFALAVLSGASVFIPYIGPAIAVLPGMMLALSISPHQALLTGLVYLVALSIEGNLSQPLLQRWAVAIPPVVNLLAILVFSPLFGIWGAVLATPLAVVLWLLVKMAYVEDVLKDRSAPQETEP